MPNTRIVLIGFRATGKTTVGHLLSEALGLPFVDLDTYLENFWGQSIAQIVEERGWDYFRAQEKAALKEMTTRGPLVLACGGGAVLHAVHPGRHGTVHADHGSGVAAKPRHRLHPADEREPFLRDAADLGRHPDGRPHRLRRGGRRRGGRPRRRQRRQARRRQERPVAEPVAGTEPGRNRNHG